jgi:Flp pilus assembly protein TadD
MVRRMKLYVPIVVGGLFASVKILHSLGGAATAGFSTQGVTPARYALTECRAILTYIRLYLIPVGQNGDWGLDFYRTLRDGGAWVYLLGMIALVAVIVWTYRRARLLSFGLLTFLVMLLPTSSIVPIKDAIAERRMYVPVVGLILASIWALDHFRPRVQILRETGVLRVTLGLLLVVVAALTFQRSQAWSSDTILWADSASKNPSNSRAHMGLGTAYLRHGFCAGAVKEYQIVDRLVGSSFEVTLNMAAAYQCNRQPELALQELRKVAAISPSAEIYDRIGYLEATLGHVPPALESFENALRLNPNDATAYSYRGTAKLALKDAAGAQADLRRALELQPANDLALEGLATLAAQK